MDENKINIFLLNYFSETTYKELLVFFRVGVIKNLADKNVSLHNINIVLNYMKDMRRKGLEQATKDNNAQFMGFLLSNYSKDLDKLNEEDLDNIIDIIDFWKKPNGEYLKDSTKHAYKVLLKKFLDKYGTKTHNDALIKLSNFEVSAATIKRKLPDDLLTDDDITKMIMKAKDSRDKALIAVTFESGARVGEIFKCKYRDVKPVMKANENWYYLTLHGKTGDRQVMIFKYQQLLRNWLNSYTTDDPLAPLFPTTRLYTKNSFIRDEQKRELAKDDPRAQRPLSTKMINNVLKNAADKAGIKKNVHAHLLRHSQGTRLANTMTEQQLKVFMGWQPGSNMTQVYIHLSGKDIDKATLKSYGVILEEDAKGDKVERCTQCNSVTSPGVQYCSICGFPLTIEAKNNKDNIEKFTTLLMTNPEVQKMFFDNIQKEANKK